MAAALNKHIFLRFSACRYVKFSYLRCLCTQPPIEDPLSKIKPTKAKQFAQRKYLDVITNYITKNKLRFKSKFQRRFPATFKLYNLFMDGLFDFWKGCRQYYTVSFRKDLELATREELDNYRQIPSDIAKVSPVLIIQSFPFMNVIFPIAYYFPKQMLSRQFWTPEQRILFGEEKVRKRLWYYSKVLAFLEKESAQIHDRGLSNVFNEILWKLEQGKQPEIEELLEVAPLFTDKPFGFDTLYSHHPIYMRWLLSHSWNFAGKKRKMFESAQVLHFTNRAIAKEGFSAMSLEDLQQSCMYRGLLITGLTEDELKAYLRLWVDMSLNITVASRSLLLHSHIFLSYNHPANKAYTRIATKGTSSTNATS